MTNPAALYEPLKVYLMLGGKAPKVDADLVVAWLREDWAANRYPGEQNRGGRTELEKHLRAMLELGSEHDVAFSLNQPLVESAQRSLGRMTGSGPGNCADRIGRRWRRPARFAVLERAGAEAPLIFETTDGSEVDRLRVPALYTHAGFNQFYLTQLASVAQRVVDEQWVSAPAASLAESSRNCCASGLTCSTATLRTLSPRGTGCSIG